MKPFFKRKPLKSIIIIIVLPALLTTLSGCDFFLHSSFREIDTLQMVQTFGIDVKKDSYQISISTGAPIDGQPSVIISRPGESLVQSDQAIQDYSSKEDLYFAHTRYVLMGEDAAKSRTLEVLDFFARSSKLRTDIPMFVVKNSTAFSLISQSGKKNNDITESLSSVERDVKESGFAQAFTCREIIRSLSEYGSALICAVSPSQSEGSIFTETGTLTATSAGYGILREGKLAGYLDKSRSWGANMLTGKSGYSPMVLTIDDSIKVSLHTEAGSTKFDAVWNDDGSLQRITAEVDASGVLVEVSASTKDSQEQFINKISSAFEAEVRSRCEGALAVSQELKADFLGIKGFLRKEYPKQIYAFGDDFVSAMAEAEIEVSVKGTVLSSFDLDNVTQVVEGDDA